MKFLTDSHFHIGTDHLTQGRPCQDYAMSGVLDGAAFAAVSDGCSTAGEEESANAEDHLLLGRTDIGSRLVTLATARSLTDHWVTERTTAPSLETLKGIATRQLILSGAALQIFGLRWQDLYATSLYAFVSSECGYVMVEGDGVVAYQLQNGTIVLAKYDWVGNMPFYPAYAQLGYQGFIAAHGGDLEALRVTSETWEFDPLTGLYRELPKRSFTLGEGIRGIVHGLPSPNEMDTVAVFTDGVTRFSSLNWRDVVVSLMTFKTREGPVVTKRMTRYLRDCRKTGNEPADDVGYAVILLKHQEGTGVTESP